jgi:hypothetical protein
VIEGRLRSVRIVYDALRKAVAPLAPAAPAFLDQTTPVGPFRFPQEIAAFLEAVGVADLSRDFKTAYLEAPAESRGSVFDRMRIERVRHEVAWDIRF